MSELNQAARDPALISSSQDSVPGNVISVRDLSKTYRDGIIFRKKFPALSSVSLDVGKGEVFGLLGPNGAGKTTFLKILLGIISKTSGQATLLNHAAGNRKGRSRVGYLPERLRIPTHMTAHHALHYYGNLSNLPKAQVREKQESLLKFVGLDGRGKDRITKYSKGMLQRLGLAQALLHDPQLLVMDEPTDGLDPGARAEMRELMRTLQERGVTIFLNSHLLQEVEMVCDRVAILNRGHLKYCGDVHEIGEFVRNQAGDRSDLVSMELGGNKESVMEAIGEPETGRFKIISNESTQKRVILQVRFDDQDAIDAMVDRLRKNKISLMRLARETISLEDAFLQIVARANQADLPKN